MGRGFMMSDCQALEMAPAAPAKTPVPCAFPAPNIAHQALASVPLPAAVPQDYRKSICMSAQPPLPRAEAKSESPARKMEDDEKTRVTVWNPTTGKKLSGNAGVQKKNLAKYLRTHPDWVVWNENHRHALKRKRIDMELERARQQQIQKMMLNRTSASRSTFIRRRSHSPCSGPTCWRCALRSSPTETTTSTSARHGARRRLAMGQCRALSPRLHSCLAD